MTLDLIIEPEQLEACLNNPELLIIDLSQAQTYAQVHVPGAIHINSSELVCGIPRAVANCPTLEQLTSVCPHRL